MDLTNAPVIISVVGALCTAINVFVTLSLRARIAEESMKTRDWVNGSFLRASTVAAQIEGFSKRLERVEERDN